MLSTIVNRIAQRWRTCRLFAREGSRMWDRFLLGVAGFARGRPFDTESAYGRMMAPLAGEVTSRVKKAGGLRVTLDLTELVDVMVFEELIVEEIYPIEEVPFIPDLVVDAGACHGLFALIAHGRFPQAKLVCIEPEPSNAERVRRHLADNQISADMFEAVLSTSVLPVIFTGGGFGGAIGGSIEEGGLQVEAVRLQDILDAHRPRRLLLKMDIEGAEREVLPPVSDLLPHETVIFIETHHSESECDSYLGELRRNGFAETVIRRRPSEVTGDEYVERMLIRH